MSQKVEVEINCYWAIEQDVARCFNRLKGKIFNLVEATITDKTQKEAVIGLVKGFANDEYKLCKKMMREDAMNGNIISRDKNWEMPETAEPLESAEKLY